MKDKINELKNMAAKHARELNNLFTQCNFSVQDLEYYYSDTLDNELDGLPIAEIFYED